MKKEKHTSEPAKDQAPQPVDQPETAETADESAAPNVEELKQQASKAAEHWERLLRTTADFDNFRKRAAREKQEAIRFANEALLEKLIPVLDNFDAALQATKTTDGDASGALQQGVAMVFQQFKQVLQESGLEEINAMETAFDPNLHEAISVQETAEVPEGQVLFQTRKGYKLRERLLRPASVIVAKPPEPKTTA
jgi:molecular chaperone GrpE